MSAEGASALGRRLVAVVLTAGAVAAAGAIVVAHAELRGAREDLLSEAREHGVDDPLVVASLRRTEDPERQRARLARVLLVRALSEPGPQPGPSPASGAASARRAERLGAARQLGRHVLERRPASWEAATVLGTSTFLLWLEEQDPRLLQEYGAWEEPLRLGRRLAPGRDEPERYLATAYLELWPFLSEGKRELARDLLARSFEHRSTFDRLMEPWLRIAGDDPELLSVLPSEPRVWRRLREMYGRTGDWDSFCAAWKEERRLLHEELARRLAEAERLLGAGELLAARRTLFAVVDDAPREVRFARYAERALRLAPHGPGGRSRARAAAEWLSWSVDLCGLGDCPFSRRSIARLGALLLSDGEESGPELALAAWASLVAGDHRRAERLADRGRIYGSEPWGPYLAETARLQVERGRLEEARSTLQEVHPTWRDHPIVRRAWRELARRAPESRVVQEGAAVPRESWSATAWSWSGAGAGPSQTGRVRLELLTAREASGVEVELGHRADGSVLQVLWDGESVGCFPFRADRAGGAEGGPGGVLAVEVESDPGPHLLELETLGGRPISPGAVKLMGRSSR